jgi:hypothetical protein
MRTAWLASAIVFALSMPLFARLAQSGDHEPHAEIALGILHGEPWPPHPLFHLALIGLTAGTAAMVPGMTALLLAAATAGRAWITSQMLQTTRWWECLTLTLLLAVAMPLPNWWKKDNLLGQPSPNVWYSPTFLVAAPFTLAAFWLGLKILRDFNASIAAIFGLVLAGGLLAKPNYALAFLPCYAPTLLLALWRGWHAGQITIVKVFSILFDSFFPAACVVAWQALWFKGNATLFIGYPLAVWHLHSPNVPASIVLGSAFPLTVLICYPRSINTDRAMILAWTTFGVAIATFAIVAGVSGARSVDANYSNWGWGMHQAATVLFVQSSTFVLSHRYDWRTPICWMVLLAQATIGFSGLLSCLSRGQF